MRSNSFINGRGSAIIGAKVGVSFPENGAPHYYVVLISHASKVSKPILITVTALDVMWKFTYPSLAVDLLSGIDSGVGQVIIQIHWSHSCVIIAYLLFTSLDHRSLSSGKSPATCQGLACKSQNRVKV